MSHLLESLMYVNNVAGERYIPWHGLGVGVDEAQTSKEAIKIAGLDWEVHSKPIYNDKGIEIPNYKANTRSTDDSVLGIVSNRYKIVQNSEAFDFTDSLVGEGCTYETAGSLMNGKKIFLTTKLPGTKIVGDDFENFIVFTNSHDGLGSIQACMAPVRVVCNNTLNLALNNASRKWTTRHLGDIQSKLDEAKHTLQLAHEYMDKFAVVADQMANTTVREAEVAQILDSIYAVPEDASDRIKANAAKKKEDFMIYMFAPDILKFKDTAWGVINAASDFATHSTPARQTTNFQENRFNNLLNGDIIIDKVFARLMNEKVLKTA